MGVSVAVGLFVFEGVGDSISVKVDVGDVVPVTVRVSSSVTDGVGVIVGVAVGDAVAVSNNGVKDNVGD